MAINFPQANLKQSTRATAAVFNNERRAIAETDKGRVSLPFWSAVLFLFSFKVRYGWRLDMRHTMAYRSLTLEPNLQHKGAGMGLNVLSEQTVEQ